MSVGAEALAAGTTFNPSGQCVDGTYTVPAGITELHITAEGAQGSAGSSDTSYSNHGVGGVGGFGSKVVTSVPVTPGQVLYVNVADGYGGLQPGAAGYAGGPGGSTFGGPANVGGPGGSSSWVSKGNPGSACAPASSDLLVVAAGGGGGGASSSFGTGGAGGTEIGGSAGGNGGNNSQDDGGGGSGATPAAAGGGGPAGHNSSGTLGCRSGGAGTVGMLLQGGYGGDAGSDPGAHQGCQGEFTASGSGGGGGGGYYGGGGGGGGDDNSSVQASGGGGGAGSSYVIAGATGTTISHATSQTDRNVDPAVVIITPYDTAPAYFGPTTFTFTEGVLGRFTLSSSGYPVPSIGVDGLPGSVFQNDNSDGTTTISGEPSAFTQGVHAATVTMTNTDSNGTVHTVTQAITFIVNSGPSFVNASLPAFFNVGTPASFAIQSYGAYPAPTLTVQGALPPGISLIDNHDGTGSLSGTPTGGGIFAPVVHADNAYGSATQSIALETTPVPTTIAITSSKNPAAPGDQILFTIKLTPAPTNQPTLQISIDGASYAYETPDAGGNAYAPVIDTLSVGFHTVTVSFAQMGEFGGTPGTLTQRIAVTSGTGSGTMLSTVPTAATVYYSDGRVFAHTAAGDVNQNVTGGAESIAFDTQGNLFYIQGQPDGSQVLARLTPQGDLTNLGPDLTGPRALAIDAAGYAYVAQGGNFNVFKISPAGVSPPANVLLGGTPPFNSGGNYVPMGIAVDAAGNAFITDISGNTGQIIELTPPYNTAGVSISIVASGLNQPRGLAVDALDNIFVTDSYANKVYEIPISTGIRSTIASGLTGVNAVTIDAAGILYIGTPTSLYQLAPPYTATPTLIESGHNFENLANLVQPVVTVGQPLLLTGSVVSAAPGGFPGGTVTFKEGATTLASGTLSAASIASASVSTLAVGTHLITASYGGSSAFPGSTSSVTPVVVAPIAVPVTVTGTRVYGSTTVNYTATPGTLPSGITGVVGTLTGCHTSTSATTNIGSYSGTIGGCSGLSATGANLGNYAVNYIDGGVTIGTQTLAVKVTGNQVVGSAITYQFAPVATLPNGITLGGALTGCNTTVAGNAPPGTYSNTISACSGITAVGSTAGNYTISYVYGDVVVVLPTISVSVSATKPFGGGISPTFSYVVPTSFPYGITGIGGTLTGCTTSLGPNTAPGNYTGTLSGCGGLTLLGSASAGYTIAFVDAGITITPRSVVVQIAGSQLPGGAPVFRFTPLNNFPLDVSFFDGSVTGCTTSVASNAPVGVYHGTISGCTGLMVFTGDGVTYAVTYTDTGFSVAPGPTATTLVAGPVTPPELIVDAASSVSRLPAPYTGGSTSFNNFVQTNGLAVLSNGQIVVPDLVNSKFLMYGDDGSLQQSIPITTGVLSLAVDSHDNVFGVGFDNSTILEFVPPYTGTPTVVSSGFVSVYSIALDGADNLYIADHEGTFMNELTPPYTGLPVVIAQTLLGGPIALDAAGNLYVGTRDNGPGQPAHTNRIAPPYNGAATNIGNQTGSMALDNQGNLFLHNSSGIFELPAAGGQLHLASDLTDPGAIAVTRPFTTVAQGAAVTLSATVASTSGGLPGGSVTFFDGPASIGNATLSGASQATATLSISTLSAGTHFITAQYGASTLYTASTSAAQRVIVGAPSPSITFGPVPSVVVGGNGSVVATASSGLPVVFSTTSATCSISASGTVTGLSPGQCVVTATQAGDGSHLAALPAIQYLTIGQGSQSITFGTAPTLVIGTNASVTASGGSSNNPVLFSTTSSTCSVTPAGLVTALNAGACVITANQAGNASYIAATAMQSLTIVKASQSIVFGNAPSLAVNDVGVLTATGGASGNTVTFSTSSSTCSVSSGGSITALLAGTCVVDAAQPGSNNYTAAAASDAITIVAANQYISFGIAPGVVVGASETLSATASSGLTVSFSSSSSTCSVSASGVVVGVNAGVCIVATTQSGNANFLAAAPVIQSLTVAPTTQSITFGAAPSVAAGTTGNVSASGGLSANPVTFASASSTCTVTSNGAVTGVATGPCVINASQAGSANYLPATATQTLTIGQGTQAIVFGNAPGVTVGGTGQVSANGGGSGNAVTFTSKTVTCSVSPVGLVTGVSAGFCVIAAAQPGNPNYLAAPQVTQLLTVTPTAQTIVFDPAPLLAVGGTAMVGASGGGSGNPVTFSSVSSNCSVISAGSVTGLSAGACVVQAAQQGNTNYAAAAPVTQMINVGAVSPLLMTSFGDASVALNGVTTFDISISNPNDALAFTGVAFNDALPGGLRVATPNGATSTCGGSVAAAPGGSVVTLSAGTLAGASTCVVAVNVQGVLAGPVYNSVVANAIEGGSSNTANSTIVVVAPALFNVDFAAASIPLGGSTALSFTLQNPNGLAGLSALAFTESLPNGLVLASPIGLNSTCTDAVVTAVPGTALIGVAGAHLSSGTNCSVSVNVVGATAGTQSITTSAPASAEGGNGQAATASIDVVAPPLLTLAFASAHVAPNATTQLAFTITNPAVNAAAQLDAAISNTLPGGLVLAATPNVSNTCGGSVTASGGGSVIALGGGSVAAHSSCVVLVDVAAASVGTYTDISGNVSSSNGGNGNSATAVLRVSANNLVVTIDDGQAYARNGELLNYLVTVTNAGNSTLNDITISETLSPQLDVTQALWTCASVGASTCTASGSGLLSDAHVTLAASGSLSWMVSVPVLVGASGSSADNAISASSLSEPSVTYPASDSDVLVIFRNSFDDASNVGSAAAAPLDNPTSPSATQVVAAGQTIALTLPGAPGVMPIDRLLQAFAQRGSSIRVERLYLTGAMQARLVAIDPDNSERPGPWLATAGGSITLVLPDGKGSPAILRTTSGQRELSLRAASAAAYSMVTYGVRP